MEVRDGGLEVSCCDCTELSSQLFDSETLVRTLRSASSFFELTLRGSGDVEQLSVVREDGNVRVRVRGQTQVIAVRVGIGVCPFHVPRQEIVFINCSCGQARDTSLDGLELQPSVSMV